MYYFFATLNSALAGKKYGSDEFTGITSNASLKFHIVVTDADEKKTFLTVVLHSDLGTWMIKKSRCSDKKTTNCCMIRGHQHPKCVTFY